MQRFILFKQKNGDFISHGTGLYLDSESILITSHSLFDDMGNYYLSPDGGTENLKRIEGEALLFPADGMPQEVLIQPFVYQIRLGDID